MTRPDPPRILVVDDEEAILETMTFTFMDAYEVLTAPDAAQGLRILEESSPVAVVLTDQRMPNMTGVEFLKEVYALYPTTSRIILTGFADSEATIQAINDGHVYAYVNKPWEPLELKQIVARAVQLHELSCENERLVTTLSRANVFLEAVMDRLETGALALDPDGIVQAINGPARKFLGTEDGDLEGSKISDLLARSGLEAVGEAVQRVTEDLGGSFEDIEMTVTGTAHRLRVSSQQLDGREGEGLGRVLLFKEISHEPLRRQFDEVIAGLGGGEEGLRDRFGDALSELAVIDQRMSSTGITSPSMAHLSSAVSRARTAIESWLEVDDLMSREAYPDAQLVVDRMRLANHRWPSAHELPGGVARLARQVEAYYDSGENPKQRVL
jgi:CheY-like chemotaxis protein